MKTLLSAIVIMFSLSCFSENLLMKAILKNDLASVKSIVEADPGIVNKEMEYLSYPLLEAVANGRIDIVKYLLEKGAKIDAVSTGKGETAVLKLARGMEMFENSLQYNQYLATIDFLAEQKLSFTAVDKEGRGPLYCLSLRNLRSRHVKNYIDAVKAFIKYGAKFSDKGNLCCLNNLLWFQGVPVDGKTIELGSIEAAKELVALGASVNDVDENKDTPLHVVLKTKLSISGPELRDELRKDIVRFLVEKGAKTNVKNNDKKTPMDLVAKESPLYEIMKKTKPGK